MLVHFASGTHPFPKPWRNVDLSGADQDVDLLDEFPDDLTDIQISYVGHWLEHMTPEECVTFLGRVRDRMAPDGLIVVIGPDVEKSRQWRARGAMPDVVWEAVQAHGELNGNNRGGVHVWDCTADAVVDLLNDAGWENVAEFPIGELVARYPDVPMINDSDWQLAVSATVPAPVPGAADTKSGRRTAAK